MTQVVDTISRGKLRNPIFAGLPYSILQCGVPIGTAPTGTMAANGAVTFGTALNTTYDAGLWLYYASGAVYAGSSAGFYWTVMSSTTVGTVYNNTYTPGSTSFDIPASPTAISAAGPGAFTGVTSEITVHSVTIPGGSLGLHGSCDLRSVYSMIAGTNNKTVRERAGTISINDAQVFSSGSVASARSMHSFGVCGVQTRTWKTGSWVYGVGTNTVGESPTTGNNWANDVTFTITLQLAVATDYIINNAARLVVYPS